MNELIMTINIDKNKIITFCSKPVALVISEKSIAEGKKTMIIGERTVSVVTSTEKLTVPFWLKTVWKSIIIDVRIKKKPPNMSFPKKRNDEKVRQLVKIIR